MKTLESRLAELRVEFEAKEKWFNNKIKKAEQVGKALESIQKKISPELNRDVLINSYSCGVEGLGEGIERGDVKATCSFVLTDSKLKKIKSVENTIDSVLVDLDAVCAVSEGFKSLIIRIWF